MVHAKQMTKKFDLVKKVLARKFVYHGDIKISDTLTNPFYARP